MKWVKEWVAGWSSRQFFSRSSHQLTSRGAASSGYPLILDSTGKVDNSFISGEYVADTVGAMVTGNTETGITVTYQDADNTLDFVLSDEYIQDVAGAMVTGGTESGISVTYDDTNARFDFDAQTAGDARYGRLSTTNTWASAQTFSSGIVLGNETLTVYDEGTWTPILRFGTGTTGITYTTQTGVYTRIGNRVFIHCLITLSSKGSSTGNADISGLPFTVGNSSPYPARWLTMVTSFIGMFVVPSAGGTTIAIRALTAASADGGVAITNTAFNNTSTLNFEANYKI